MNMEAENKVSDASLDIVPYGLESMEWTWDIEFEIQAFFSELNLSAEVVTEEPITSSDEQISTQDTPLHVKRYSLPKSG